MDKKLFAFDVDETLEISNGPVKISDIKALYDAGHIVGICGNWRLFVETVPEWNHMVSFVGQFYGLQTKAQFLDALYAATRAKIRVLIGNDPAHYGNSNDIEEAKKADWTFVREDLWKLEDWI